MKLVAIDTLPDGRKKHKLQKLIDEFVNSDAKICRVDLEENEYASLNVAYSVISNAARRSKRCVKLHRRNDELYLVKEI